MRLALWRDDAELVPRSVCRRLRVRVAPFDPDFRLTFDHDIQACASAEMFPRGANMRAVLPGRTVMEVKFRHHVPSWFHSIIQAYELRRVSVSKICAGMSTLGLQLEIH